MKNIKKYIIIFSFVVIGSYSIIYAHGGNNISNSMNRSYSNMSMQQGQVHNGMNKQLMQQIRALQDDFMNRLKKEVDDYTAKQLNDMILRHRQDMREFMRKKSSLSMNEIGILREKMRQRHFEDLRNVLKEYPEVYKKYSEEMRQLMKRIMQMRQKGMMKGNMNGNMNGMMGNRKSMRNMGGSRNMGDVNMNNNVRNVNNNTNIIVNKKQRLYNRIDNRLEQFFKRLENKSVDYQIKKLEDIIKRISIAKDKLQSSNSKYKIVVLEILEYIEDKVENRLKELRKSEDLESDIIN